jgi:hypothetical protein
MLLYFNGSYHPIVSGFFFEQKPYQHHSGVVNTKNAFFSFFYAAFWSIHSMSKILHCRRYWEQIYGHLPRHYLVQRTRVK